jgi:hypothetical protein
MLLRMNYLVRTRAKFGEFELTQVRQIIAIGEQLLMAGDHAGNHAS